MRSLLNMLVKPSTRAFFSEKTSDSGHPVFRKIHGYIYGRWPYLYIGIGLGRHPLARVVKPLLKIFSGNKKGKGSPNQGKIEFANGYHGKVLPVGESKKLIRINKSMDLGDLEQIIPYTRAREMILKNPDHIAVLECPCRASSKNPCLPMDVCLIIGEPFADFILEHHPGKSRRITADEASALLEEEHKKGHVQHAFFKDAMLNRFYAICSCCSCCCGAMQAFRSGVPMLASSGYVASFDLENCQNCGKCSKSCQFKAITMVDNLPEIDTGKCMGCGVCVDMCKGKCISLVRDPKKPLPLEITALMNKAKNNP